jgi:hypothetical protein
VSSTVLSHTDRVLLPVAPALEPQARLRRGPPSGGDLVLKLCPRRDRSAGVPAGNAQIMQSADVLRSKLSPARVFARRKAAVLPLELPVRPHGLTRLNQACLP